MKRFDYDLFCLIAEKERRKEEKRQKALRSLTDEQLDALIEEETVYKNWKDKEK